MISVSDPHRTAWLDSKRPCSVIKSRRFKQIVGKTAPLASPCIDMDYRANDCLALSQQLIMLPQSGVSYNGLHWADNEKAPYDYGDVTLMGEAAGLIMRKTAGGRTLYQVRIRTYGRKQDQNSVPRHGLRSWRALQ